MTAIRRNFRKGDKVYKARPYKALKYCRFGGDDEEVPIGTKGEVINTLNDEIQVRFENGKIWTCDKIEIKLEGYKEVKKTTCKVIKYRPGLSIKEYVKNLLTLEKDKERIKWLRTFDNCVLPKSVRDTIDEALTIVLRSEMFDKWGINEHFEKGLTNSILIYGPPGTGKTMVSESISAILGMNMMKITNADLQSNIPGQTEKNMTESFRKAKTQDALIMLDECDSMLYNRNAVGAIMSAEINHLLSEIENFSGIVIMTTNRLHKLDEALQRRIIAKIELPFPDKETREQIWKKLIPQKMPVSKLDFDELSKASISGGEIKNAILLSARKAIAQNRNIVVMTDFRMSIVNIIKAKEDFEGVQPNRVDSIMDDYSEIKKVIK